MQHVAEINKRDAIASLFVILKSTFGVPLREPCEEQGGGYADQAAFGISSKGGGFCLQLAVFAGADDGDFRRQ